MRWDRGFSWNGALARLEREPGGYGVFFIILYGGFRRRVLVTLVFI
jgi:hypothetical protein